MLRLNLKRAGLISPQWRQSSIKETGHLKKGLVPQHLVESRAAPALVLMLLPESQVEHHALPLWKGMIEPTQICPILLLDVCMLFQTQLVPNPLFILCCEILPACPPHRLNRPSPSTGWVTRWPAHGHPLSYMWGSQYIKTLIKIPDLPCGFSWR